MRRPNCLASSFCLVAALAILAWGLHHLVSEYTAFPRCVTRFALLRSAILNYDVYRGGRLPSAHGPVEEGQPKCSWRVKLLPFLEYPDLYEQYAPSHPWDNPENSRLLNEMPPSYRCPRYDGHASATPNYLAVVGPRTAWQATADIVRNDIPDSPATTILIVDVDNSQIQWTEPRDLSTEDVMDLFTPGRSPRFPSHHPEGVYALMADGSFRVISKDTAPEVIRAMLTRDGGESLRCGSETTITPQLAVPLKPSGSKQPDNY
ncbi:MAG: DUF1559 domain-containing protein [Pirellulales bacterium]|nr:DUF1559 domain-containing protein [Pirellulales bacterium]